MREADFNLFTTTIAEELERLGFQIADHMASLNSLSNRLVNILQIKDPRRGENFEATVSIFEDLEVKMDVRDEVITTICGILKSGRLSHKEYTFDLTSPDSVDGIIAALRVVQ